MNTTTDIFPRRSRDRQSAAAEDAYWLDVERLRRWMQAYKLRLGFAQSSRGWCYALESAGSITKGEFDLAVLSHHDVLLANEVRGRYWLRYHRPTLTSRPMPTRANARLTKKGRLRLFFNT